MSFLIFLISALGILLSAMRVTGLGVIFGGALILEPEQIPFSFVVVVVSRSIS